MCNRLSTILMAVAAVMAGTGSAWAVAYTAGHGHIGVGYEDGALDLHFHAEGATMDGVEDVDAEYSPSEVTIVVPAGALTARPSAAAYDWIGNDAGDPTWVLPQHHAEGLPFLGFGAEEIALGEFVGDTLTFTLTGVVSAPAGGEVSMWTTDAFGSPTFWYSTVDGGVDSFSVTAGGHGHASFGFTASGTYTLAITVSGVHVTDGYRESSAVYTVSVVPEPATLAMAMLGGVAMLRRRVM